MDYHDMKIREMLGLDTNGINYSDKPVYNKKEN